VIFRFGCQRRCDEDKPAFVGVVDDQFELTAACVAFEKNAVKPREYSFALDRVEPVECCSDYVASAIETMLLDSIVDLNIEAFDCTKYSRRLVFETVDVIYELAHVKSEHCFLPIWGRT